MFSTGGSYRYHPVKISSTPAAQVTRDVKRKNGRGGSHLQTWCLFSNWPQICLWLYWICTKQLISVVESVKVQILFLNLCKLYLLLDHYHWFLPVVHFAFKDSRCRAFRGRTLLERFAQWVVLFKTNDHIFKTSRMFHLFQCSNNWHQCRSLVLGAAIKHYKITRKKTSVLLVCSDLPVSHNQWVNECNCHCYMSVSPGSKVMVGGSVS